MTWLLGLLFAIGMLLPAGWLGTVLVIPWWVFSVYRTLVEVKQVARSWITLNGPKVRQLLNWAKSIAPPLFLTVAASWAIADRLTLSVMGFDATITLLTAVHFHYAGFTLAWLLGRVKTPAWVQWCILSGVALVAVGITTSQYGLPAWIEVVSVTILALAAFRFSFSVVAERGWLTTLGGLALAGGMLLALAYGWRYVYLWPVLDIPTMYALHGSLNSLGFALPLVLNTWLSAKGR